VKRFIQVLALVIIANGPAAWLCSQMAEPLREAKKSAYKDPNVVAAVDFLRNRFPQLLLDNPNQAAQEYLAHYQYLQKIGASDLQFMEGHYYADLDDVQKALPYFTVLAKDPLLGAGARRMLDLLLYRQVVYSLQNEAPDKAQAFLGDVVRNNTAGIYYPTYLYLLLDSLAESGRETEVGRYISEYNAYRDWILNSFKPRKAAVISELDSLNLSSYYKDPSKAAYLLVAAKIDGIQNNLRSLYEELKAKSLYFDATKVDSIFRSEVSQLDDLKNQLQFYSYVPPLDLKRLAEENPPEAPATGIEAQSYQIYRKEAIKLNEAKHSAESLGKKLADIDKFLEDRYQLYVKEDPSVLDKGFSDMELKRLFDIEKNIGVYNDVLAAIDKLMADPGYPKLKIDLRPQRQEYVEKLADLQNRKQRYLAFRKHPDKKEEDFFNDALTDYYALNQAMRVFDQELPETEDEMHSMITRHYFREKQKVIKKQQAEVISNAVENPVINDKLSYLVANLDFLGLQLDYRRLRFKDRQYKERTNELSDAEASALYQDIILQKAALLTRYQDFIAQNPDFRALEQPSGGYLLDTAAIYYNMGELQYAVDLDHPEKALADYRQVLESNPQFYLRDYALFNIGYLSQIATQNTIDARQAQVKDKSAPAYQVADFQESIDAYSEIARSGKFKDSPLYETSLYQLGILYFMLALDAEQPVVYYTEAKKCFEELTADPAQKYYYEATYQRGWINLNEGDDASLNKALDDFIFLIRAVDDGKITDQALAQDYKANSINNIAYTLAALDGVDFTDESKGVKVFQQALANYKDVKVAIRILEKAASNKADLDAPLQAIDFLELRLRIQPLDLQNPSIVDSIVTLYYTPGIKLRSGKDLDALRFEKFSQIVSDYNHNAPWYQKNISNRDLNDPAIKKQLKVIRKAYEEVRVHYYNIMIETAADQDIRNYYEHMQDYAANRDLFGNDYAAWLTANEKTDLALLANVAEKRQTNEEYMKAIQGIWKYNDKYLDNADYFYYEGLANKYVQTVYKNLNESFAQPGFAPSPGLPANSDSLYVFYRDASSRFINVLNMKKFASEANRQLSVQVTIDLANIQKNRGMIDQAITTYYDLLKYEDQHSAETNRTIYLSLADIALQLKNYPDAEKAYRNAYKYNHDKKDAEAIAAEINLVIQTIILEAEKAGNFEKAAREYLRLADEFKTSNKDKYVGNRNNAAQSFIKAGNYQSAIDVKLEMVPAAKKLEEKYSLYYDGWMIADTLMHDQAKVKELKDSFIALAPSSNYTYQLKVEAIEKELDQPGDHAAAADAFLTLYNDVRANKIDSGPEKPEDIYLRAVEIYRGDGNTDKVLELLGNFVKLYPKDPRDIEYLVYLADNYSDKGDRERFEYYARELFLKDKSKYELLQGIAYQKLAKLGSEFDQAYRDKDWDLAFRKRDEFKQVEATYKRDKLPMDTSQSYLAFTAAENEYKELKAKENYLSNFERTLRSIEQGDFLRTGPADMVLVTKLTTWQGHLFGGLNRIPKLNATTQNECARITTLLKQREAKYLSVGQVLHAFDLICRLNDHAALVTETQIDRYIEVSREMRDYKLLNTDAEYQRTVKSLPYTGGYLNQYRTIANGYYLDIYNNYALAGWSDQYTARAEQQLKARNLLPAYKIDDYPLNPDWTVTLKKPDGLWMPVTTGFTTAVSLNGKNLGVVPIPAHDSVTLEQDISTRIPPEMMFLHLGFPILPEVFINDLKAELNPIPVDSLDENGIREIVNSCRIDGKTLKAGANKVKIVCTNPTDESLNLHLNSALVFDSRKLLDSLPTETVVIPSDAKWVATLAQPEVGKPIKTAAILAKNFTLPIDRTEYLANSKAQPIWVQESPENPQAEVSFETDFNVSTVFREGYLDFVAPETASVYLNGEALETGYFMEYQDEPFLAIPHRLALPKDKVLPGKNNLRIEIQNSSANRGMLAELRITQTIKEQ